MHQEYQIFFDVSERIKMKSLQVNPFKYAFILAALKRDMLKYHWLSFLFLLTSCNSTFSEIYFYNLSAPLCPSPCSSLLWGKGSRLKFSVQKINWESTVPNSIFESCNPFLYYGGNIAIASTIWSLSPLQQYFYFPLRIISIKSKQSLSFRWLKTIMI